MINLFSDLNFNRSLKIFSAFLLLNIFYNNYAYSNNDSIVIIRNTVQKITSATRCAPEYWPLTSDIAHNTLEDACLCCLIKFHFTMGNSSTEAIAQCAPKMRSFLPHFSTSDYCTDPVLQNIAQHSLPGSTGPILNIENRIPFYNSLFKNIELKYLPVVQLTDLLSPPFSLNVFNPSIAKNMLENAVTHELLPAHAIEGNFTIKDLKEGSSTTGMQTLQLYVVKSVQDVPVPILFLKESKKSIEETENLEKIRLSSALHEFILSPANRNIDRLTIALPYLTVSYKDIKNNTHYISILPAAPGSSLGDIINDSYRQSTGPEPINHRAISLNNKRIQDAGLALGYFQQRVMRVDGTEHVLRPVIAHGDLHVENIFVSNISHAGHYSVTLIDNETMASTLDQSASPIQDIIRILFHKFVYINPWRNLSVSADFWGHKFVYFFLRGYLLSFSHEQRDKALSELDTLFTSQLSTGSLRRIVTQGTIYWVNFYAFKAEIPKILEALKVDSGVFPIVSLPVPAVPAHANPESE